MTKAGTSVAWLISVSPWPTETADRRPEDGRTFCAHTCVLNTFPTTTAFVYMDAYSYYAGMRADYVGLVLKGGDGREEREGGGEGGWGCLSFGCHTLHSGSETWKA